MNWCIEVGFGMWAFVGLLSGLCGLVMAGVGLAAWGERRGAAKEKLRKVQCGCAVRVVVRHGAPAANGPSLRS